MFIVHQISIKMILWRRM